MHIFLKIEISENKYIIKLTTLLLPFKHGTANSTLSRMWIIDVTENNIEILNKTDQSLI